MKIISKIKNVLISAGIAIMILPRKVFGALTVGNQTAYGVENLYEPSDTVVTIWKICKYFLIPLMIIIGIIIYWKKSKVETKKKVIGIIIAILLVIALGSIIEKIIDPNGLVL